MIISIVIVLIIALVIIAIMLNAVQQQKEKQAAERRAEVAKQKLVIDETEEVLLNAANIPMSKNLIMLLQKRIYDAIRTMAELMPESKELRVRMEEAKSRIESPDPNAQDSSGEALVLPDNDKQIIGLVQGIKKLRAVVRSEHSKGKLDPQVFINEDKRLERLQLRINVESLIKRGRGARSTGMVGSARQYFEKALATIAAQTSNDEYVQTKRAELEQFLTEITNELKNANADDRRKKQEAEKDDLDVLFAPKKKW